MVIGNLLVRADHILLYQLYMKQLILVHQKK